MSRAVTILSIVVYFVTAVAALFWWAPHFFAANTHLPLQLGYRYLSASGVPFALMLISVIARQSVQARFSMMLLMEVLLCAGLLWCALYAFYYPPQANFFAAMHLLLSGVFAIVNFYQYRRTLKLRARYAAAEE